MTEKQPEALRIVDAIKSEWHDDYTLSSKTFQQACDELRRLAKVEKQHAELLESMKQSLELVEREVSVADSLFMPCTQHTRGDGKPGRVFIGKWYEIGKWRAAITKAEATK